MTHDQALEIIGLLKSGKYYKSGHYHYGYTIIESVGSDFFTYRTEDLSINMFEPTIEEQLLSENQLVKRLMDTFVYEEVIRSMN